MGVEEAQAGSDYLHYQGNGGLFWYRGALADLASGNERELQKEIQDPKNIQSIVNAQGDRGRDSKTNAEYLLGFVPTVDRFIDQVQDSTHLLDEDVRQRALVNLHAQRDVAVAIARESRTLAQIYGVVTDGVDEWAIDASELRSSSVPPLAYATERASGGFQAEDVTSHEPPPSTGQKIGKRQRGAPSSKHQRHQSR